MNDCKEFFERIHLLVEGELDSHAANELQSHLSTCSSCSQEYERLLKEKHLFEETLEARVRYHDTSEHIIQASLLEPLKKKNRKLRLLKGAGILAAASVALAAIGIYAFAHMYFKKTFSYQLHTIVSRCSEGIEQRSVDGQWRQLSAGAQLQDGTLVRTPGGADAFFSVDQARFLSKAASQIETLGRRSYSLDEGEIEIAAAKADRPLYIFAGALSIEANGAIFRVKRLGDAVSVGVASGVVTAKAPGSPKQSLGENETAALDGKNFVVASENVKDPFERLTVSVLDRIKQRFALVMSKYIPNYMLSRKRLPANSLGALDTWQDPGRMLRFASYSPPAESNRMRLAQLDSSRLDDYYESLFVPSNRSISLGRQKLIPLGSGMAASLPAWSHDGSMIAYTEYKPLWLPAVVKVARLDDLENPWTISQEIDWGRAMFPVAWTPDNRHVLFQAQLSASYKENDTSAEFGIKIAPIDPAEGPLRDFKSPLPDIPFTLPLPIGGTISPCIVNLPWGDAILCANWGNIGYIPIDPDGTAVPTSPGLFLTNFNPRETFVVGVHWSPSANKLIFMGVNNIGITEATYDSINVYVLYDVDDILDGFTQPPRSIDDPRIKHISPTKNTQYTGGFSFDESLVFYEEDVNNLWKGYHPTDFSQSDFDLFYADATPDQPSRPTQIHLPGNQMFLRPSPEGNRLAYCNYDEDGNELRVISFGIEANMDMDLGGVLIDNSGTNLIVPPGALQDNFKVHISTPLSIWDEVIPSYGDTTFFAMRLLSAEGLENPKFIEPMTLTIRYTDSEVGGMNEAMLDVYYYDDQTDPAHPQWVPLGGTVDPDHNEITVEIRHFSTFAIGGRMSGAKP